MSRLRVLWLIFTGRDPVAAIILEAVFGKP
jgi:hypothetical protein